MKIYTGTGDKGETGLYGGSRISKDSALIHAIGAVDECNAMIGIARAHRPESELTPILDDLQHLLFRVGADLATPGGKKPAIPRIDDDDIARLEKWIDELEETLPKLKNFIVPGGGRSASYLHLARTVCRRAERWTIACLTNTDIGKKISVFLNRLSDLLFVAARSANLRAGQPDRMFRVRSR